MLDRGFVRGLSRRGMALGALVISVMLIASACQSSGASPAPSGGASAAPSAGAGDTFARIKADKVVTVGFINEPPYNFATAEKLTGGYPEALRAFFATIDPEIKMNGVLTEFSALIPGLVAKRFDINGGGMNIRPARCAEIAFANPEVQALTVFLAKKGNPKGLTSYKAVAEHADAKYGAVTGGIEVELADVAGIPKDRQVLFPDLPSLVAGLQAGRVDVLALTSLSAADLLAKTNDPNLELVELTEIPKDSSGAEAVGYVAIGFRKEDKDLLDAYNAWQANAKTSGELLKIMEPFGFAARDMAGTDKLAVDLCKA
jgi:polar amino acid transport system substrate-binding protein